MRGRAFILPSTKPPYTVSPSTFQPDIGKPADTWLVELQRNSGQDESEKNRQTIFKFNDNLFPAVRPMSKLKLLLSFAVDKPT